MTAKKIGTLSHQGQITIPKNIRETLNLHPNDGVMFEVGPDGRVTLSKVEKQNERSASLKSIDLTLSFEWGADDDDDL